MMTIPNPFFGPAKTRSGGKQTPGFEHHRSIAKAAREQPGVWLDLVAGRTRSSANGLAWRIRNRPSIAFRPVGAFEVREERRGDGYAVLVRYVGGPP